LIADYRTIIEILKINKIEQSKATVPVHDGKNIHELVADIRGQLETLNSQDEPNRQQAVKDISLKIGALWQTKQMNPPYYFSLEFQFGTYMPFISPFLVSILQIAFALGKQYFKERSAKKEVKAGNIGQRRKKLQKTKEE